MHHIQSGSGFEVLNVTSNVSYVRFVPGFTCGAAAAECQGRTGALSTLECHPQWAFLCES